MIVIEGIQVPDAGLDLALVHCKAGIELEKAGVTDEPRIFQLLGNGINVILPAKGQNVCRADPGHPAQGHADGHRNGDPHNGDQNIGNAQKALAAPALGAALGSGMFPDGDIILLRGLCVEKLLEFRVVLAQGSIGRQGVLGVFAGSLLLVRERELRINGFF